MQIQKHEFPKEWSISTINELREKDFIYEIQDGNHGGLYPRKKDFSDNGRIFLTANSIAENGQINIKKSLKLPEVYWRKLRIGFAKPGDVLFTHNATVGRVAILPKELGDCILGTSVTYYRLNINQISRQYFAYCLQSPFFKNQLNQIMFQTTRAQVPITTQARLKVIIPTLKEQQKIAAILSKVDELIQKTEQIIELTQRLRKGLVQRLLTKGIGHTKFKKTKLGEIPEEWEVKNLEEICNTVRDGSHFSPKHHDAGFPLATVTNMKDNYIDIDSCYKISIKDYELLVKNGCKLELEDVLFSKDGTVGLSLVYNQKESLVVLSSIAIIRPKKGILNPYFVKYVLQSDIILGKILVARTGTALRRIILKDLRKITIPIPQLIEQQKIVSIISQMDNSIITEQKKRNVLFELKKGLMQQLLTGKIRINV